MGKIFVDFSSMLKIPGDEITITESEAVKAFNREMREKWEKAAKDARKQLADNLAKGIGAKFEAGKAYRCTHSDSRSFIYIINRTPKTAVAVMCPAFNRPLDEQSPRRVKIHNDEFEGQAYESISWTYYSFSSYEEYDISAAIWAPAKIASDAPAVETPAVETPAPASNAPVNVPAGDTSDRALAASHSRLVAFAENTITIDKKETIEMTTTTIAEMNDAMIKSAILDAAAEKSDAKKSATKKSAPAVETSSPASNAPAGDTSNRALAASHSRLVAFAYAAAAERRAAKKSAAAEKSAAKKSAAAAARTAKKAAADARSAQKKAATEKEKIAAIDATANFIKSATDVYFFLTNKFALPFKVKTSALHAFLTAGSAFTTISTKISIARGKIAAAEKADAEIRRTPLHLNVSATYAYLDLGTQIRKANHAIETARASAGKKLASIAKDIAAKGGLASIVNAINAAIRRNPSIAAAPEMARRIDAFNAKIDAAADNLDAMIDVIFTDPAPAFDAAAAAEIALLKDEVNLYKSEYEKLHPENSTLRAENETLRVENKNLRVENDALRKELDTLRAEIASLRSDFASQIAELKTAIANKPATKLTPEATAEIETAVNEVIARQNDAPAPTPAPKKPATPSTKKSAPASDAAAKTQKKNSTPAAKKPATTSTASTHIFKTKNASTLRAIATQIIGAISEPKNCGIVEGTKTTRFEYHAISNPAVTYEELIDIAHSRTLRKAFIHGVNGTTIQFVNFISGGLATELPSEKVKELQKALGIATIAAA